MSLLLVIFIPLIALSALMMVSCWKLFAKAGEEGWKSLIPVYNLVIMTKIGLGADKQWLALVAYGGSFVAGFVAGFAGEGILYILISLASSIINIYILYAFAKSYSDTGMAIASIFVPIIIYPIIALSDKYVYAPSFAIDSEEQLGDIN